MIFGSLRPNRAAHSLAHGRLARAARAAPWRTLGRPVDQVGERLRAVGERRIREPVEVEIALAGSRPRARSRRGCRRTGRAGRSRGGRAPPSGTCPRRCRARARRRAAVPTTPSIAARQVGSKPAASSASVAPARRRSRTRRAELARSRAAPAAGRRPRTCAPSRAARIDGQQPDRPAAEDGDEVALAERRAARARRRSRRAARPARRAAGRARPAAARATAAARRPLGEDAGAVHADQPPGRAEVVLAGQAALALAAGRPADRPCTSRRRRGRRPRARARAAARAARDGPGSRAGRSRRSPRARPRARPRPRPARAPAASSSGASARSPCQTSASHRRSTIPPRSPVSAPVAQRVHAVDEDVPHARREQVRLEGRAALGEARRVEDDDVGARARRAARRGRRGRSARPAARSACGWPPPASSSRSSRTMKRQNHDGPRVGAVEERRRASGPSGASVVASEPGTQSGCANASRCCSSV